MLTPLAVDPAHPFPYISGLSLNLAVLVRDPDEQVQRFARVKVPNNVPRFVVVSQSPSEVEFLPIEDLIAAHLPMLFPGMEVVEHHLFRVTRNADFEVEEDRDEDLLQALERELARRRFGPAVRLEVADDIDDEVVDLLASEIEVGPDDVLRVPGLLDLSSLRQVYDVDRPALKERPFVPTTNPRFAEGETPKSVFATLRDGDVLVHHPYESFATSTQRFIEQAAADPGVLAIKQTLYRTSGDSPIVDALIDAAEAGKQVVALVEIKARFDEQANIKWARALERAGCHVVYGFVGLKTHCKTALVVRQEGNTDPALRPRRHRQLQPQDRAHVRGPRPVHRRPRHLRRPHRPVQRAHRVLAPDRVPLAAGGAAGRAGRADRAHRARDRARPARPAGAHPVQDEPPGRRADDRRAVPGVAGRRAGRAAGAHVLHDPRRRAGAVGEHHRPLDPRPLPRALARLLLRRRRRPGVLDRARPTSCTATSTAASRCSASVNERHARAHLAECLDFAFDESTAAWDLQPDGEWVRSGDERNDYQEMLMKRLADRGE